MCCLFGIVDVQGIIPHKMLKKFTQALANAAEERGTDAAGISYIKAARSLSLSARKLLTSTLRSARRYFSNNGTYENDYPR